nr:hypothetical protein [Tanacetum cinerariifolium]
MDEVAEDQYLEILVVEQLLDEADKLIKVVQDTLKSPYDTESEIKVVKSFLTSNFFKLQDVSYSDLQSMVDDDLGSISGFEDADSNDTHENESVAKENIETAMVTHKLEEKKLEGFSPTPPRELTPPRVKSKGKGIATEEPLKEIMSFMEEGEQELRKMFNQATLKGQSKKWHEHEAKKVKIIEEYNHLISFRADPPPITKISYAVNINKEATMKITRGDNPLNLISKKLGLPSPSALRTFGMTTEDKKRKRLEFLKKVFITENIIVDGMHKNLIPPPRVVPIEGFVINEPKSGIFFMNRNTDIAFQRENEFHPTPTIQLIRIQNQIKVDSEIVDEMLRKMIYVIEARCDCTKARKTAKKNLDDLG